MPIAEKICMSTAEFGESSDVILTTTMVGTAVERPPIIIGEARSDGPISGIMSNRHKTDMIDTTAKPQTNKNVPLLLRQMLMICLSIESQ